MADDEETENPTVEEDDDEEESETSLEFQTLFEEATGAQARLKKIGAAAKAEGNTERGAIYSEIAGTVLQLHTDLIAACGGAFEAFESRIEEIEESIEGSRLTEEDAQRYLDLFGAYVRLIEELEKALPESGADEQRTMFAELKKETEAMIEMTKDLGDIEEEAEAAGTTEAAN